VRLGWSGVVRTCIISVLRLLRYLMIISTGCITLGAVIQYEGYT